MKPQTRQLISLPGRLIIALRDQPSSTPQLEKATGASQKTVAQTLELLHAHGIVEWRSVREGTPGRPSRIWQLATDDVVADFERACDAFRARLLRRQLDQYDDAEDA
jgi:predicted ArsR family transcriptional regulator